MSTEEGPVIAADYAAWLRRKSHIAANMNVAEPSKTAKQLSDTADFLEAQAKELADARMEIAEYAKNSRQHWRAGSGGAGGDDGSVKPAAAVWNRVDDDLGFALRLVDTRFTIKLDMKVCDDKDDRRDKRHVIFGVWWDNMLLAESTGLIAAKAWAEHTQKEFDEMGFV